MLFMKGPGRVLNKCDAAACFFNSHFVLNCFADCPRHFLAIFTNRGISECRRWARWGWAGAPVALLFYAYISLNSLVSVSGLGHFSDDDLSFFDLPKRAATPRGSEAPRSSRAAKTALAPLIVSPRNNGASVMFVDLPECFCIRKSISRAGLPGLRARDRGDDEQSPVGGDGVVERDWFSLELKLSLTPNWRT